MNELTEYEESLLECLEEPALIFNELKKLLDEKCREYGYEDFDDFATKQGVYVDE